MDSPASASVADAKAGPELVIGLVGAVGVALDTVCDELQSALNAVNYRAKRLHLTDQLAQLDWDAHLPRKDAAWGDRVSSYMTAGNELRERWDATEAFGLLAVNAIQLHRASITGHFSVPAPRQAYILHSLKRKEEAEFLRAIYGEHFVLISAYAPRDTRHEVIVKHIERTHHPLPENASQLANDLIARDEAETGNEFGQQLRKIFPLSDVFVDVTGDLAAQLTRAVEIIFGHPARAPNKQELGMFQAFAASLRSGDLGRQVGAAILTEGGSLVATGANEVPVPKGGLYWVDDGEPDPRDYALGYDANDHHKRRLSSEIAAELHRRDGQIDAEGLVALIAESKLDDLIEFVRAVHAEMAAITDAAMRGVAVKDATLYATTFPCHHCARHIVAAGITRVVYVEPYPKSLAGELHDDAIAIDSTDDAERRVHFDAFVGIGPRRFVDWFTAGKRKDQDTGIREEFVPERAVPRLRYRSIEDWPTQPPYLLEEVGVAVTRLANAMSKGPEFVDFDHTAFDSSPARGQKAT